jgi:hypothetical protein
MAKRFNWKKEKLHRFSDIYNQYELYNVMQVRKCQMLINSYPETFAKFGKLKKNNERSRFYIYDDKLQEFISFIQTTCLTIRNRGKRC